YVIVYASALYSTVHIVSFVTLDIVNVLFSILPVWLFVHVTSGLEYPLLFVIVNIASSFVSTSFSLSSVVPFITFISTVFVFVIVHVVSFVTLFIVIMFPSIFPL